MPSPIQPSPLDPMSGASPPVRFLSNGHYVGLITATGTGFSRSGEIALTAWSGDRVEDRQGFFVYLRDVESRAGWSLAHWPAPPEENPLRAQWTPGRFTIARDAEGIEARLEVCVATDADAEIRRLTLINRSPGRRVIELTTYGEVVLNDPAAHAAHPAFSKLFVQTEYVPARRALLARRRPRAQGERYPWLVHALLSAGDPEVETDRARFLGRRAPSETPEAFATNAPLSGTTGNVLDPIVCLRWRVAIEAGATARCAFLLGAADGREEALALAERFASEDRVEAAFAAAEAAERDRYTDAGLSEAEAEACQAVAGAMLFGDPTLRPAPETLARAHGDLNDLIRLGVSPKRPFAVANLERPATAAHLDDLLKAHRYWRALGLPIDLVLVHAGAVPAEVASLPAGPDRPLPGVGRGRLARRTRSPERRGAVGGDGLADSPPPLDSAPPAPAAPPRRRADRSPQRHAPSPAKEPDDPDGRDLTFFNGFGGFSPAGDEYVIRLDGCRAASPATMDQRHRKRALRVHPERDRLRRHVERQQPRASIDSLEQRRGARSARRGVLHPRRRHRRVLVALARSRARRRRLRDAPRFRLQRLPSCFRGPRVRDHPVRGARRPGADHHGAHRQPRSAGAPALALCLLPPRARRARRGERALRRHRDRSRFQGGPRAQSHRGGVRRGGDLRRGGRLGGGARRARDRRSRELHRPRRQPGRAAGAARRRSPRRPHGGGAGSVHRGAGRARDPRRGHPRGRLPVRGGSERRRGPRDPRALRRARKPRRAPSRPRATSGDGASPDCAYPRPPPPSIS